MNTPIGAEAEQMQRAPSLLGPFCQLLQRWGVSELIAAGTVSLIRTNSWRMMRPAPMVRWPTSELPIC